MTLIERPYAEIVDDILTAIVGGVVNEPIWYDDKEDSYPLSQPARGVRSITGTRSETANGELRPIHFAFRQEADYLFNEGSNAIEWQPGGKWPDDETIFYVDYFPRDGQPPLTDINIGSVTRTLGEAIGAKPPSSSNRSMRPTDRASWTAPQASRLISLSPSWMWCACARIMPRAG